MVKKLLFATLLAVLAGTVCCGGGMFFFRHDVANTWETIQAMAEDSHYLQQFNDAQELADFIVEHPENFSLVVYTVSPFGNPLLDTPATPRPRADIFTHNARAARPLASTMKIVHLAAYARGVAEGTIDPDEKIPLADWERHHIAGTDGGAHVRALEELGLKTGDDAQATLDQLARAMIRYSDNAATDYFTHRFGLEIDRVLDDVPLSDHTAITPLSGSFLLLGNHKGRRATAERMQELVDKGRTECDEAAWELARLYAYDEGFRRAERGARWRATMAGIRVQHEFIGQITPSGSASDYARLMSRIAQGELFSERASEIARRHLEWPMQFESNQQRFERFGTKGGSLAGILTEASYMTPNQGDYAGQTRVVVLLAHGLPLTAWVRLTQTFAHQELMVELATSNAAVERLAGRLGNARPNPLVESAENEDRRSR